MAWRNLWRNTRRTAVTVAAMAFALWIMLLYSALVEGYLQGMEGDVLDFEVGEIQVFAEGYRDNPSIWDGIEDADQAVRSLEDAGYRVAPRLSAGGLGAVGDFSSGVNLRGIDVERDGSVLRVHERILDGAWLDTSDPQGVVLGRRLARTLAADVGDELLVLSQATDGSTANALYTVRGVLGPVGEGTDRAGVFMTTAAFRELLVIPEGGVHQLIVRTPQGVDVIDAADELDALLVGMEVLTWRQLMPTVATMLDSSRGVIYIVFFIIYIAIGILILNAMLMAVFERIREFGVMKAIGVGPGTVMALILTETAIQTAIAMVAGLTLAVPTGWYLATEGLTLVGMSGLSVAGLVMPPVWLAVFTPGTILGPLVVMLAIVSVAVIYPAAKASLIQPVVAMRHT